MDPMSITAMLTLLAATKATQKVQTEIARRRKLKEQQQVTLQNQLPTSMLTNPMSIGTSHETWDPNSLFQIKTSAPIIGIPDKSNFGDHQKLPVNQMVDYIVSEHLARRAGKHTDVRIGNPELGLLSWASRKGVPAPGEKRLAVQQPVHDHAYKDFHGTIESGYGAGEVKKPVQGQALITKVTPDAIHFSTAHTGDPERFALIRSKDQKRWLMINTTPTNPVEHEKTHYTSVPSEQVEGILQNLQPGSSVQAKIDGSSSLTELLKDKFEAVSYRAAKGTGYPIVHTERIHGGRPEIDTPKDLIGTILRGELYGTNPKGEAIPAQELGGLLNSGLAKSLKSQKDRGVSLKNLIFDIHQLGGKKIGQDVPYAQRLQMVKDVISRAKLPQDHFTTPDEATTPEDALKMWKDVGAGKNPLTHEGVIIHPPTGKPMKSKFMDEHDVVVRNVFPGEGKYQGVGAGGFEYSHDATGPIVGRVGTGLSDETRRMLWDEPSKYIGRTAKVLAQQKFESGALRAPSFQAFHEDISPVQVPADKKIINSLLQAKAYSDIKQYKMKHHIMAGLFKQYPKDFHVDSEDGTVLGVTHTPSGFRMHLPLDVVPKPMWDTYKSTKTPPQTIQTGGM